MTELEILDILYQAFQLALRLALPFLLISMLCHDLHLSGGYPDQ